MTSYSSWKFPPSGSHDAENREGIGRLNWVHAIAIAALLSACATAGYQKAVPSINNGRTGYGEVKIAPDTYILEYSDVGGSKYYLEQNEANWKRRANELCPSGYDGEYRIIHPVYARIEKFYCLQRHCGQYPLVSGVIRCKDGY